MNQPLEAEARPPLTLVDSEADALSDLAWNSRDRFPDVCDMLLQEINRANMCTWDNLPGDVVTMASQIDYVDERSGQGRTVELVYPHHADASLGRISIMTPIGAALIGLSAGSSIFWPDRDGRHRTLTIKAVRQPPRN
ncbi:regulator of nucleoside diphosphate kinase [Sphingobium faniae]|nr:regulator of nucleoside diphosphate kinase [Sphingobium faniae]